MFKLATIASVSFPYVSIPVTVLAGSLAFVRYYNPNTSLDKFEECETNLLNKHVKTNFTKKKVFIDEENYLNTLKVESTNKNNTKKPNILLIHGWGAGLPLWSRNIDKLAEFANVYAIDLLGFGLSSRPPFSINANAEDAKRFWLDSIHKWKQTELPDEKVIIVGHSLGGYLSCAYTLENPDEVEKLILAAPVGIAPWKFRRRMNDNDEDAPVQKKLFTKVIRELVWTYGYSPQSILRGIGYYSKRVWDRLGEGSNYRELDKDCWDYLYHSQISNASGDIAFLKFISLEGWTTPLYEELPNLKVPMRIIYGERDYVPHTDGPSIISKVSTPSDFVVLPRVGHHLYWTKHDEFANSIAEFVTTSKE